MFTIYNDGTSELVIDSPAALVSGAGFSLIEPAPAGIAAGSSGSFRVRLSSPGAGTYSGTVTVWSNDPTSPFEFAVRGTVQ